jgi:amino acid transporter
MSGPKRELTLVDAVCLVVGVIIGAGVYSNSPDVASATTSSVTVLGLWLLGGFLSLLGALCYAELAAAYPHAGGDYVYLTRAYGPWAGFLFGWSQLTVVRPGDIATMALVFAEHGEHLLRRTIFYRPDVDWIRVLGTTVVVIVTLLHMLGVQKGKWTQNILTVAKVLSIVLVMALAFLSPANSVQPADSSPPTSMPLSLALIFVLFCYGGWNEMAYLAGEVREPQRNVLRGLLIGTIAVTLIYVALNAAFLHVLGRDGLASSKEVAADAVSYMLPHSGKPLVNSLICLSTLGAINGLVFSGSRISFALGNDYSMFRWLGKWEDVGAPRRALLLQGALAATLILVLGSKITTLIYTSIAVYTFYTFTSLAVIVLRYKDRKVTRPYFVTGFPVTVIVFASVSVWLLINSVQYILSTNPKAAMAIGGVALMGIVVYLIQAVVRSKQQEYEPHDP